jgi:hypothetical protein
VDVITACSMAAPETVSARPTLMASRPPEGSLTPPKAGASAKMVVRMVMTFSSSFARA